MRERGLSQEATPQRLAAAAKKACGPIGRPARRLLALPAGALAALFWLGCPKAPPPAPGPPSEAEQLAQGARKLSEEARELVRTQDETIWRHWTTGAPLDLAKSYEGRDRLLSAESIALAHRAREAATSPEEVRALTHLKVYLVGEQLSRALAEHTEAITNLEASMTFSAEGQEYAYRDLERLLANEASAIRRKALYEGATPAVERLSQSLWRKEERIVQVLHPFGYTYETYGAELRQVDVDQLGALADEVLRSTEDTYLAQLERLAPKELGLPLAKLKRADFPRLFRPRGLDAHFPKDKLLSRAADTLKGLGFDPTSSSKLKIDLSESPGKVPRPLTVAVQVPDDVRLSIRPTGGANDQADLLHELGHAMHYALSPPGRFELSRLGSITASEAFAFLFEDLIDDPIWLEEQTGLSGAKLEQSLEAGGAQRLNGLRKAAGGLLYQIALHRGHASPRELYGEVMSRALGIELAAEDRARFLVDSEDFYQSAEDLRAWVLAGQLQAQLKARFGPSWWRDARAGAFLRALFHANALTAEEVAVRAGEAGLRPEVLLLRLTSRLGQPRGWVPRPFGKPMQIADGGSPGDWRPRP
ncbi:MAG: chromosome segregation protein SMC [Myxococcales bacterium]|nr:chromosome segregation protein SMC [Myxococcales bacterium]